ncbi:bifunctional 4-hydroxy-2-oxoglutarate aldolase/2-dehydro-3-deoxy-phosphogluconate aldolase [Hyphococcus lacteus]|uniref:2-dehydro-3-deoxy-phosphogluconate aldolase n=1 Tax=Hyphococcus lacteus TaxID=3143536 RepID=A0ABV3Z4P7_9PROT
MLRIGDVLDAASVIPVLEVPNIDVVEPLANALARGGLRVVELTLRTDCALEALSRMKDCAPELIVGIGTVRTALDIERSRAAGADFLVSPGTSKALMAAMQGAKMPALPGVATASEAMTLFEAGFTALKLFPAETSGGIAHLKALNAALSDILFCPTGGINADKAVDYLALPNVACVGGSWIATKAMIEDGDWVTIEENAKIAASIKS